MTKRYNIILSVLFTLISISSCDYKELEESGKLISVKLNMDFAAVDSIPKAIRVAFYPADDITQENNKRYTIYDLPQSIWTKKGNSQWQAQVNLARGVYDIVAWNNDTEHVLTEDNNSQMTLCATTQEYTTKGSFDTPELLDSIYNGQKVVEYPDYMTHSINTEEDINENSEITLSQDSMVVTVDYKIHGIGGLAWVKQIRGSMNNVAGKRYIANYNRTEETVAVMFDCNYNQEDSLVYGTFYVFGIEPTEMKNLTHKMILFFWMDAAKVFLPIDITEIIRKYRKENKKIIIDIPSLGIDLRDYITSKNTFDVNVETWDNINIDVGF